MVYDTHWSLIQTVSPPITAADLNSLSGRMSRFSLHLYNRTTKALTLLRRAYRASQGIMGILVRYKTPKHTNRDTNSLKQA